MIFKLLAGIVIGAGVFAGFFWAIGQALQKTGKLRVLHATDAALTIAGMATLSLVWPDLAKVVGLALVVAAFVTVFFETGWNRVLPLFLAAFGAALIANLPFA